MKGKGHSFNVLMPPVLFDELSVIAHVAHISRGQAVRQLVHRAYLMIAQDLPLGADGSKCFVPQMHDRRPKTTPNTEHAP
jgi:hypothetical protein